MSLRSVMRPLLVVFLIVVSAACVQAAGPATVDRFGGKLDSRLAPFAFGAEPGTTGVWVEFADKGERDPADLAARLAAARAALTPRALARRLRNHVTPIVDYRDVPVAPAYLEALAAQGMAPIGVSRWFNRAAVRVTREQLAQLAARPEVAMLRPIERMVRTPDPAAPDAASQSERVAAPARAMSVSYGQTAPAITQMNLAAVHDSGFTGSGVLICVLDDGFNWWDRHEAMSGVTIAPGFTRDFVRGVAEVQDTTRSSMRHGTWTFGCMAGRKFGTYVGAAYDASFALGRTEVDESERPQEMINWGLGAEWADSLGADIISSSLGYSTFDTAAYNYTYADMDGGTTTVTRAAQIAAAKGILVVNAVGNEGNNSWHYLIAPADAESTLAVGAVDATGAVASFSSYGPSSDGRVKPDVAARGVSMPLIGATSSPTFYTFQSGTSFSTPLVAGAAACLLQGRPTWSARDVANALRITASHAATPDFRTGYGIIDANAALHYDPVTGVPGLPNLRLLSPNPARLSHGVQLQLAPLCGDAASARVRIVDVSGRVMRELWSGPACAGVRQLTWDGRDAGGRLAGSGVYFVSYEAGGRRSTLRVVALR